MNWLTRIFAYSELQARLEDKNREIARLTEDIKELRDRLFIKYSLPVSGAEVTTPAGESVQGWAPKRTRLKEYINKHSAPLTVSLTDEERLALRNAAQ